MNWNLTKHEAKAIGSRFYLAAKPCHKGHAPPVRYVSSGRCRQCAIDHGKRQWAETVRRRRRARKETVVRFGRERVVLDRRGLRPLALRCPLLDVERVLVTLAHRGGGRRPKGVKNGRQYLLGYLDALQHTKEDAG
jgi:hypothetical protein